MFNSAPSNHQFHAFPRIIGFDKKKVQLGIFCETHFFQ